MKSRGGSASSPGCNQSEKLDFPLELCTFFLPLAPGKIDDLTEFHGVKRPGENVEAALVQHVSPKTVVGVRRGYDQPRWSIHASELIQKSFPAPLRKVPIRYHNGDGVRGEKPDNTGTVGNGMKFAVPVAENCGQKPLVIFRQTGGNYSERRIKS